MHVFVTGVGGFSGARLAENFVARGWTVTGLTRNPKSRLPALSEDRFHVVTSDASDLDVLPDGLDAVVHVAATMPFVGASDEKLWHDNVEGTRRLIDLSLRHKVGRFVFFSSTSVFGREHTGVLSDASQPADPESYGRTKIECERLLVEASARIPVRAIRPPGIIGAGAGGNWVASVAAKIAAGQPITYFNPDAPFNNCVHIADLAALVVKFLEQGFAGYEAAIVCADGEVRIRDVVDILMRGLGRTVEVKEGPATRRPFTISSARAKNIWGWKSMTVAQSLTRYADEQRIYAEKNNA
jgi:nucleoside-diphosphate-sugar epimerase